MFRKDNDLITEAERLYVASQYTLMWRRFRKHRLAITGAIALFVLYFTGAAFCEFFSTQEISKWNSKFIYCPPQRIE